ncbi:MAG TPA: hypothetical protein VIY66_01340 [Candidatus Acidoferrales bacterium]
MNRKLLLSIWAAGAAMCMACAIPRAALGNPPQEKETYSPPRLSDGTPDLRGIWEARTTAYLNIEGHAKEKGIAASKSLVVDTADGKIPYLPDARKQRDDNFAKRESADPASNCFQAGVPRAVYLPTPFQIVQSPGNLAIVYTDAHAYRIVDPTAVPHDDGIDYFMGDSRSHWEGNTLVIDVVDLGDETWLDEAGNYHSDQLHVVERYTLVGPNTMRYEARLEDSKVYSKPWSIRLLLYRDMRAGARITEDECLEGPDRRWHHLSPSDPRAILHHDYAAELAAAAKNNTDQAKQ